MPLLRISFCALIIFLVSCHKDRFQPNPSKQLKRIEIHQGDSIYYSSFQYDADQRIVAQSDSDKNGNASKSFFVYNAFGNLVKIDRHNNNHYLRQMGWTGSDSFRYESNRVTARYYKYQTFPYVLGDKYTYDLQGRMIADSSFSLDGLRGYSKLTYDNEDNVVEWQWFEVQPNTYITTGKFTAVYDNSINNSPFKGYLTNWWNQYFNSKHNPKKVFSPNGAVSDYSYEFDGDGFLIKATTTHIATMGQTSKTATHYFY